MRDILDTITGWWAQDETFGLATVVDTYRRAGARHVAVYVTEDQPLEQFERLTGALVTVGAPARG